MTRTFYARPAPVVARELLGARLVRRDRGRRLSGIIVETEAYEGAQDLGSHARAGLTQEAVASRMGTTKSAVSRLESAGKHAPSLTSLKKYAKAVGCEIEIRLIPRR